MRKVNDSTSSPLRYISKDGTTYGQFYISRDKTYHLAKYIPYHTPPRDTLCKAVVNRFISSREEREDRNKCVKCFSELARLRRRDEKG